MIVGIDRYIAAEAERWLAAKFKERGIKCSRETRIKAIAHWLGIRWESFASSDQLARPPQTSPLR